MAQNPKKKAKALPEFEFDEDMVINFGRVELPVSDIADHFCVQSAVVQAHMDDAKSAFSKAYRKGRANYKANLRGTQRDRAIKGKDNKMLAFLGSKEVLESATMPVKRGAPTKYRAAYCARVLELGASGTLPDAIAMECGISKQGLHRWGAKYPAFRDAFARARHAAEHWWLDKLKMAALGLLPGSDSNLIKYIMSAVFGYREKTETIHSDNITVEQLNDFMGQLQGILEHRLGDLDPELIRVIAEDIAAIDIGLKKERPVNPEYRPVTELVEVIEETT